MTNEVTQKTTSNEQNVSSSNGLEPKIRFASYSENYTICNIGDIFDERSERGSENLELLSVTMNDGVKKRTEIEGKDNSSEDKGNYKIVYVGDMVYNSMRMWQGANGISPYDGIVSPAYTVLKASKPLCNKYIAYLFKNSDLINKFRKNSQGLTSDTWNLKYPQISTIKIYLPSLPEQQKIADFLSLIDQRIEKQRQLVESLKKYKRGLLSVIFDRKIRFKDKNANTFPEWQNTTLSDIGNFYNGLSGKNKDDFITGNSEYVTYMNVFKNTIADENICERVNVSEFEHQNIVQYGDILFTQSSETMEEVGFSSVWISSKTPFLNSFCFGLRLKKLSFVYPQFMGYLLRSYKLRILIMRESQGATRINLSSERLKNIKFMLPCFDEQVVIADLIMKIDDYIAICEEKYSYLAKLKNGLLQQMFI